MILSEKSKTIKLNCNKLFYAKSTTIVYEKFTEHILKYNTFGFLLLPCCLYVCRYDCGVLTIFIMRSALANESACES